MTTNEERVFGWFERHADGDGFVDAGCPNISHDLSIPLRTVQGAMSRLERQGKVFLIGYRRFAVTKLVE